MGRNFLSQAALLLMLSSVVRAESVEWTRAHELYLRTEYRASLEVLQPFEKKEAAVMQLIGQDYFQLGEYRKATEFLERAVALAPDNTECVLWLGRAYGRRAETSGPFTAPGYASKSRQIAERARASIPPNRQPLAAPSHFYL